MSTLNHRLRNRAGHRSTDAGSVLPMVLILMVVGGMLVTVLLAFSSTLLRNRPPIEERDRTFWTAKSAMTQAMALQSAYGPDGCYDVQPMQLNGFVAQISCTPTGNYYGTGNGRLAVITTQNDPTVGQFVGAGPSADAKPISGSVFINGGDFDDRTADLAVQGTVSTSAYTSVETESARYFSDTDVAVDCSDSSIESQMEFPGAGTDWALASCSPSWWASTAGDYVDSSASFNYPELPPMPTYARTGVGGTIGSCSIYYPGHYTNPVGYTLGAGDHYFASGVYYFESPLVLDPGARVVAGEGRWSGCAVDAEAAFDDEAPRAHEITGKGATFILGGDASIAADQASLQINRRVSTPGTRGTETVSIRSVNFETAVPAGPAEVEIPDDVVYVADTYDSANTACNAALSTEFCFQAASDHSVRATATAPAVSYLPSTLGVADEIIAFDQDGGTAASNQFVTDGYVFVPNAKVALAGGNNDNYRLRLTGGVVASQLELDYNRLPAASDDWLVGVVDEPVQRQLELFVNVVGTSGTSTTSRAIVEVNVDGSFAINGWSVDPNSGSAIPVASGPTITPFEFCEGDASWSNYFGLGEWTAEYWNISGYSGNQPTDPFPGTPDFTTTVPELNFFAGVGTPPGTTGINAENFSARFTRTINAASSCELDLSIGGDDGFRLFVDGVEVTEVNYWRTHGHQYRTANEWTIPDGEHEYVVEFFERGGGASLDVRWRDD